MYIKLSRIETNELEIDIDRKDDEYPVNIRCGMVYVSLTKGELDKLVTQGGFVLQELDRLNGGGKNASN